MVNKKVPLTLHMWHFEVNLHLIIYYKDGFNKDIKNETQVIGTFWKLSVDINCT